MSYLRRFWDGAYAEGEHLRHWELPDPSPELIRLMETDPATPGAIALDLGCGGGRDAIFLAERGLRALGLDVSAAALDLARRRARRAGARVGWCLGSATAPPFAADSVDFVVDRGCFHTLEDPARARYADAVARLLRPGGRLFLRGSRREHEEEGLFPVDPGAIAAHLRPRGFALEWLRPMVLAAPSGDLDGNAALLRLAP